MKITTPLATVVCLIIVSWSAPHGPLAAQKSSIPQVTPTDVHVAPPTIKEAEKPILSPSDAAKKVLTQQGYLREDATSVFFRPNPLITKGPGDVKRFQIPAGKAPSRGKFFWWYAKDLHLTGKDYIKEAAVMPAFLGTGLTLSRHVQHYRPSGAINVEVRGGGCVLFEQDNAVTSGNCELVTGLEIDVTNHLPKGEAINAAIAAVSGKGMTVDPEKAPVAQLMVVPKGDDASNPNNYRLAWSVMVTASDPFDVLMVDILAKGRHGENVGDTLRVESVLRESEYFNHELSLGMGYYPYALGSNPLVKEVSFYTRTKEADGKYYLESGPLCSTSIPDSCAIPQGVSIKTFDATTNPSFHPESPGGFSRYSNDSTAWVDPEKSLGVSVFWGMQKTLEFFHSRFPNTFVGGPFELYLTPLMANSVWVPLFEEDPDTQEVKLVSNIVAFRSKATEGDYCGPAVSIDSVAHEYVHRIFHAINKGMWMGGESGAIEEGFADIFALQARFSVEGEGTEWLFREKECGADSGFKLCFVRSLSNPKGAAGCPMHNPDTYKGMFYDDPAICPAGNYSCLAHLNSTIPSHWFYLLRNGGSGQNDNAVNYTVKGVDAETAQKIAYMTMWSMGPQDKFQDLRDRSVESAVMLSAIQGKPVAGPTSLRASVEDAWYAVGIGGPHDARVYAPVDGDPMVDPWPAKLTWYAFPGETAWYVGLYKMGAAGPQLEDGTGVDPSQCEDGKWCSVTFNLDADTVYYWRVIGKTHGPISVGEGQLGRQAPAGASQNAPQAGEINKLQQTRLKAGDVLQAPQAAATPIASKPSFFKRILSSITNLFSRTPDIETPKQTPFSAQVNAPAKAPGTAVGESLPDFNAPSIPPDVVPGNDGWGNWGQFQQFTTSANKPKPVPAGNDVNPWRDELKFKGIANATSYIVEISESEIFAKVLKTIDVDPKDPASQSGEFLKATISGLEPETDYFWSVTAGRLASDEDGESVSWGEPSDPDQFYTIRPSTKLIAPINSQEVNPLAFDLKWEKVPGALSYVITVGDKFTKNATGQSIVTPTVIEIHKDGEDTTTAPVEIDPSKHPGISEFSWQVAPLGPSNAPEGTPSEVGTFKINPALSAVTALYPYRVDSIKQDIEYGDTVTYFWTNSPGATRYIVNIRPLSGGNPITFEVPQQNPITWDNRNDVIRAAGPDVTKVTDPLGYCWTVTAASLSAFGKTSNELCYQTGNGPIALGYPPEGATIGPQNQLFGWSAASAPWGVYLQYWTYPGQPNIFTFGPLSDENGILADGSSVTGAVIPEGSWAWKICSFKGNNSPTTCSDTRTLIVKASAPETPKDPGNTSNNPSGCTQAPPKPTLIFPVEGNVTYVPLTFTAQWNASSGATDYHYSLMKPNDSIDGWVADVNAVTSATTQQFTLPPNSYGFYSPYGYLLYVSARNACGESPAAQAWVHQ